MEERESLGSRKEEESAAAAAVTEGEQVDGGGERSS